MTIVFDWSPVTESHIRHVRQGQAGPMTDTQGEAEMMSAPSPAPATAPTGSGAKPMDWQLRDFWEEHGDKRGVPQGVRDLLNAAFTKVPVSSFPDLPSGKGTVPTSKSLLCTFRNPQQHWPFLSSALSSLTCPCFYFSRFVERTFWTYSYKRIHCRFASWNWGPSKLRPFPSSVYWCAGVIQNWSTSFRGQSTLSAFVPCIDYLRSVCIASL